MRVLVVLAAPFGDIDCGAQMGVLGYGKRVPARPASLRQTLPHSKADFTPSTVTSAVPVAALAA